MYEITREQITAKRRAYLRKLIDMQSSNAFYTLYKFFNVLLLFKDSKTSDENLVIFIKDVEQMQRKAGDIFVANQLEQFLKECKI